MCVFVVRFCRRESMRLGVERAWTSIRLRLERTLARLYPSSLRALSDRETPTRFSYTPPTDLLQPFYGPSLAPP